MTKTNQLTTKPVASLTPGKRMLLGAAIALVLISVFLIGVKNPDPAWGKFWMIRPLIIVPVAGAMGGLFYHIMGQYRAQSGWIKIAAWVLSVFGFIVVLWMGTVLGLDGTLWD
jgi:hypothetical protein